MSTRHNPRIADVYYIKPSIELIGEVKLSYQLSKNVSGKVSYLNVTA